MKNYKKILFYINIFSSIIFLIIISYNDFKNTNNYYFINPDKLEEGHIILINDEDKNSIENSIKRNDKIYIAEFSPSDKIFNEIKNKIPDSQLKKVYYVHFIKYEELEKYTKDIVIRRFVRAFEERKIQYFLIPDHPNKKDIIKSIEKDIGPPIYNENIKRYFESFHIKYFANFLIFINLLIYIPYSSIIYLISILFFYKWSFAIAGLFFSYIIFFRISNKNIFKIIINSILFGILLYSSGFDYNFIFKLNTIRGVKLLLIGLPLIIILKYLKKNKFDKIYKSDIIIVVIGILSMIYYLIRSNNWGFVLNFERQVRDFLDHYLIARPRTKELISYFFYIVRPIDTYFGKLVWSLGKSLLPISILDTFLHFHSPIYLGVLRSFNSFLIAVFALIIFIWIKKLRKSGGNNE